MSHSGHPGLLPAGLGDGLPPEAEHEADVVSRLMAVFRGHGYERVKPPLIEFEDNLLAGTGSGLALQTFRLMDPASQRMMGLRADMTLQVARIATTRLGRSPRPLRLAYAGQVLRVKGTDLRPERQFGQLGVELIGSLRPEADAEVVLLAAEALARVGVAHLSVDLCVPTLVPAVFQALGLDEATGLALRRALDRKDAPAVAAVGGAAAAILNRLLAAGGPAEQAVAALAAVELPHEAEPDRQRLFEVVRLVRQAAPGLTLTVDAVERRGFEFQTGVSFTLFARGTRGELGRGGRYRAAGPNGGAGEPATGCSLYTDTVLRAVPASPATRRLFLPHGTAAVVAQAMRAEGWITLAGFEPDVDPQAEARRLGCGHVLVGGRPATVNDASGRSEDQPPVGNRLANTDRA
ncbi:MAG: ATP phosphoribosyltransferase regulatory subunit [Azospirillum sp.]|nr:ATP phosphoribosyltransferase regulatory subunit [Azospirillum sp.]